MPDFADAAAHRDAGIPVAQRTWTGARFEGEALAGVVFDRCRLDRVTLAGCDLRGAIFNECVFESTRLEECTIDATHWVRARADTLRIVGERSPPMHASFVECAIEHLEVRAAGERLVIAEGRYATVTFAGAGVRQEAPTVSKADIGRVDARGARWRYASALKADLGRWALEGAELEQCALIETRAHGVDWARTTLRRCNLHRASIEGATVRDAAGSIFSQCAMRDIDARAAVLDGVMIERSHLERVDLAQARLEQSVIAHSTLEACALTAAKAARSAWTRSTFVGCDLSEVDAPRASLRSSRLEDTATKGANLRGGNLHGVEGRLEGSDREGAQGTIEWRAERERTFDTAPERTGA